MANIFELIINGVRTFIEKPIYSIGLVLVLFFMPLDIIDFILFIFVNIFVVIFNAILYLLIIIGNGIIALINWLLDFIVSAIGLGLSSPPDFSPLEYRSQSYIEIDIFDSGVNLFSIILDSITK